MTPGVKKGIIAIAVTAIIAVLVIQFAVPPGGAQTVALNNLPSTMVLGKTYSFYVTINLQGITKIAYSSTITVSVFKSSGASVASAQFNGTGTIITTGGFVTGVVFHNGSATNIYGYGGTTGYVSYQVSVNFQPSSAFTKGQYSMNAVLNINSTAPPISSKPVVFNLVSQVSPVPYLTIFIIADVIIIAVVIYVITVIRKR
ncbi:MAG: hypothetical protein KIY12_07340 [Thermoplasmata archaeon]|uniref:Uncharacterized protein n=1 Tax=Candidatus Sysuiplasma superficiale TaxID=2823368 RepID=A0A8J7YPF0_9ARCH|nr:hypothetical protein [Candidatus Sysuiplasma superficiale]MBX8644516.1 hypothetical protein [Candidatus Sysuiplasma superficiale]MCL4346418.1 hypothetical protein [Candidatus Thermoplasmatota archaeon]